RLLGTRQWSVLDSPCSIKTVGCRLFQNPRPRRSANARRERGFGFSVPLKPEACAARCSEGSLPHRLLVNVPVLGCPILRRRPRTAPTDPCPTQSASRKAAVAHYAASSRLATCLPARVRRSISRNRSNCKNGTDATGNV